MSISFPLASVNLDMTGCDHGAGAAATRLPTGLAVNAMVASAEGSAVTPPKSALISVTYVSLVQDNMFAASVQLAG